MFKVLSSKNEDAGFPNPTILVNVTQHSVVVDQDGRQIPAMSIVAVNNRLATGQMISNAVTLGHLIVISAPSIDKQKRGKKASETTTVPQQPEEVQIEEPITLVAETKDEDWVVYTDKIVDESTANHN